MIQVSLLHLADITEKGVTFQVYFLLRRHIQDLNAVFCSIFAYELQVRAQFIRPFLFPSWVDHFRFLSYVMQLKKGGSKCL